MSQHATKKTASALYKNEEAQASNCEIFKGHALKIITYWVYKSHKVDTICILYLTVTDKRPTLGQAQLHTFFRIITYCQRINGTMRYVQHCYEEPKIPNEDFLIFLVPGFVHLKKNFHISLSDTSVKKCPPRTPSSSMRARSCLAPPLEPTKFFFEATYKTPYGGRRHCKSNAQS